jgi:uncharacterized phage-like protein YoqJ
LEVILLAIYAGTGHRPPTLGLDYSEQSDSLLRELSKQEIDKITDFSEGISGMATGFDMALAEAFIELRIPFIAAVPFNGMEKVWPASGQKRFNDILAKAKKVVVVCDGYNANWKYYQRDKWMVDNADKVIALWNKTFKAKSGTGITIKYALSKNKPIHNIWDAWEQYASTRRL